MSSYISKKLFCVIGLSSFCAAMAGSALADHDEELSERAAKKLAGYELTGEEKSCLNLRRIRQITPLDDQHFLVQVGLNDMYLNRISGKCSGARLPSSRIQYTTSLNRLCRNEIIKVVDNTTGFVRGACGLSSFERLQPVGEGEEE